MWTKVYIASALVFIFVLGFVVYYSASWLGSITVPADAFAGYEYFRSLAWYLLWITTAILLVLANIHFIRAGRTWPLWATVGFFSLFVLAIGFLLPIASISFLRENGFAPEMTAYLSPVLAIALCVGFAALVYADRFLVGKFLVRTDGLDFTSSEEMDTPGEEISEMRSGEN